MAFKYQWDETSLRMFLHIDIVRRLFPEFEFQEPDEEAIAERRARGIGTRPSYLVQVMQSAGSVYVEGKLDTQIAAPAKLVQSTSAADLSIPIETLIPAAALSAIEQSRLAILLLHADSVAANKLIVQRLGSLCSLPVHDALCHVFFMFLFRVQIQNTTQRHQCNLAEDEVLQLLGVTNPMHATKKLWSNRKSREGFLAEVDKLIDKAFFLLEKRNGFKNKLVVG